MRSARSVCRILALSIACAGFPAAAAAESVDPATAEAMVRQIFYEGPPLEGAASLEPAAVERLAAMLADADESPHHANILLVLGASGRPGAFEAISDWAGRPRSGEVDRATFRAWQTLPHALGRLAAADPRALSWLAAALERGPAPFRFRRFDANRLGDLERRAAATSLAMTGLPEAAVLLGRALESAQPGFAEHVRGAQRLHSDRAAERSR